MNKITLIRCAMQRILIVVLLVVGFLLPIFPTPAFAIGNPTSIGFGTSNTTYAAFNHVSEAGDLLFVAESYIFYSTAPTDYYSNQSFLFSVIGTANLTTLLSTPVWSYGDRPVSIYISAAQATALGMNTSGNYSMRIGGNPSIFGILTEGVNQVTRPITSFSDQSIAIADSTALRNFCLLKYASQGMLININANDAPTTSYISTVQGVNYAGSSGTPSGTSILLGGIPMLATWCPDLFQSSSAPISIISPTSTGALQTELTPTKQLGQTTGLAVANLSAWLGVPIRVGGLAIWMVPMIVAAVWVAGKTQVAGGSMTVVVCAIMLVVGVYLGFVDMAWMIMLGAFLLIITVFYFFSRGVL